MQALAKDPIERFNQHLIEAKDANISRFEAFSLATTDGVKPSVRTLLFKGLVGNGLSFYTNKLSPKAVDLKKIPRACMNFFWEPLGKQVRFSGNISEMTIEQSKLYFYSRSKSSQISALISPQGKEIESFDFLVKKHAELLIQYKNDQVPFPENWGGYLLNPSTIEFWYEGEARLHRRELFQKTENGWKVSLLGP